MPPLGMPGISNPPAPGEGGLQVPVDFLRKTYGDLLGYAFEWQPETARLVISRRGDRELGVSLDVVHLGAAYLGGTALTELVVATPVAPCAGLIVATVGQALRPFPQFSSVATYQPQGYSWYHSLQTRGPA